MLQGAFLLFIHSILLSAMVNLMFFRAPCTCHCKLTSIPFKPPRDVFIAQSDAAALVLTLLCGARWTSCRSSSRLLLLFSLLKTTDVRSAPALRSHFFRVLLSFSLDPPQLFVSSPERQDRFLPSVPCVTFKERLVCVCVLF